MTKPTRTDVRMHPLFGALKQKPRAEPKGRLVLAQVRVPPLVVLHKRAKHPIAIQMFTHVNTGKAYPYSSRRQNTRWERRRSYFSNIMHQFAA
jgi:hypothetical protein